MTDNQNVTPRRVSWRLTELPPVTGLSLGYWRKVARSGKLPVRKLGENGAVVVLDDDLRFFLAGEGGEGDEIVAEPQTHAATT